MGASKRTYDFTVNVFESFTFEFQISNLFKDVRGWQFLTMKAAETLCIVC